MIREKKCSLIRITMENAYRIKRMFGKRKVYIWEGEAKKIDDYERGLC